jgi:hypothetical protein
MPQHPTLTIVIISDFRVVKVRHAPGIRHYETYNPTVQQKVRGTTREILPFYKRKDEDSLAAIGGANKYNTFSVHMSSSGDDEG